MAINVQVSVQPSPARCSVAHAWLQKSAYAALEDEAQRRRMHPDAIAAVVLDYLSTHRALLGNILDRHGATPRGL